ncbi:MAG: FHA domain-containing protein [Mycetocola sp.]
MLNEATRSALSGRDESAAAQPGGVPPARVAPPAQETHNSLVVLLPDGASRALNVPLLLGRSPRSQHGAVAVPVTGDTASVSATHALVVPVPGGALVRDLASTNGTVVLAPDGSPTAVVPGADVLAVPGSLVVLGECTLRIVRSGDD